MKMTRLAWALLGLLLALSGAGLATSGVGGFPFNPTFGNVRDSTETITSTAAGALSVNNNALKFDGIGANGDIVSTGSLTIKSTGVLSGSATNGNIQLSSAGTNNCIYLTSPLITVGALLPCGGTTGAGNYIPTLKAAQGMKSGQFYAFNIVNNGTTCATAAGSPGFPTGWSAARTSAGLCTITFPTVTNAASLMGIPTAAVNTEFCIVPAVAVTTIQIKCFTTAGTATDTQFFVFIEDWN